MGRIRPRRPPTNSHRICSQINLRLLSVSSPWSGTDGRESNPPQAVLETASPPWYMRPCMWHYRSSRASFPLHYRLLQTRKGTRASFPVSSCGLIHLERPVLCRPYLVVLYEKELLSVGFSTLSSGSQAVGSLPAPKSPDTATGSCAGWLRMCAGGDLHPA